EIYPVHQQPGETIQEAMARVQREAASIASDETPAEQARKFQRGDRVYWLFDRDKHYETVERYAFQGVDFGPSFDQWDKTPVFFKSGGWMPEAKLFHVEPAERPAWGEMS